MGHATDLHFTLHVAPGLPPRDGVQLELAVPALQGDVLLHTRGGDWERETRQTHKPYYTWLCPGGKMYTGPLLFNFWGGGFQSTNWCCPPIAARSRDPLPGIRQRDA